MGFLLLDMPGRIVIQDAIGEPVWAHGDLAHASLRLEPGTLRQGLGPVGDVHTGLGALGAPDIARTAVVTGVAPIVRTGEDGSVRRPPVPAERLETFDDRVAELPKG